MHRRKPFVIANFRRRSLRARRLRLHPNRAQRSDREALQEKILTHTLTQLATLRHEAQRRESVEAGHKERLAHALAEMENLRKRTARDKEETRQFAVSGLVQALMPALDALDQAVASFDAGHDAAALGEGVRGIGQLIAKALTEHGLERVEAQVGQVFDPNVHEALSVQKTDAQPANTVILTIQNGYRLNGRIVRPARVIVAQKP
jgi:molecular chaperone GrpE